LLNNPDLMKSITAAPKPEAQPASAEPAETPKTP